MCIRVRCVPASTTTSTPEDSMVEPFLEVMYCLLLLSRGRTPPQKNVHDESLGSRSARYYIRCHTPVKYSASGLGF